MSFILDALKKSEIERQRQAMPGLTESGIASRSRRFPLWAIAVALLLGINLVVLLFVLTRSGTPAAGSPAAGGRRPASETANSAAAPAAGESPAGHFSPLDTAPVYAPEIPVAVATSDVAPEPATASVRPSQRREGTPRERARRDPLLSDEDTKANQEVLPSISEINLTGQQALPDLHLDVHVFATKSTDRFVYINMRKYREGATLEEGPTLERIRRDGVILNFRGLRFVLPRQR